LAALAIPMNLLVGATIVMLALDERYAQKLNLQYTARAIVSATDAMLMGYIGIGRTLAASPGLLEDDLSSFRMEAGRAFPDPATEAFSARLASLARAHDLLTAGAWVWCPAKTWSRQQSSRSVSLVSK
jgi:hypothetical protein